MKLTDRDIKIIEFMNVTGASIEQLQKLYFPSYDVAANRLKILADNKLIKVQIHPILGKKVYYTKKLPSFHSLVITDISIILKDKIKFMQREYKIKKYKVDCIFILKEGKILIVEVDIYNRTKEKRIEEVLKALADTKTIIEYWIVSKRAPQGKNRAGRAKYIQVGEMEKLSQI